MKKKISLEVFLIALGLTSKKIFYSINKLPYIIKICKVENEITYKSLIKLNKTLTNKESNFLRKYNLIIKLCDLTNQLLTISSLLN